MLPPALRQPGPELTELVERAYRVFDDYRSSGNLTVCHCGVCMTIEAERELLRTPLRQISSGLLAEYTNSAHGWDDDAIAREMRHFLPRYLELIAHGDAPCSIGLATCLRRLADARWRETWPQIEVDVLDRYFDALLAFNTTRLELVHWPIGWRLEFDLAENLTLVATAGGDIERALRAWDSAEDPAATIHMAAMRQDLVTKDGQPCLHSFFLERHPATSLAIGAFLARPLVSSRIERAFFAVEDERLQRILSDGLAYAV